jgi:hypothetical protein
MGSFGPRNQTSRPHSPTPQRPWIAAEHDQMTRRDQLGVLAPYFAHTATGSPLFCNDDDFVLATCNAAHLKYIWTTCAGRGDKMVL